jgi:hypothetical protein
MIRKTMGIAILALAVATTCRAQGLNQACHLYGLREEQVALDRDSGLPREVAP